ncbi:hypothetical protein PIB30_062062 [Stylosanthes scabra]|uniref:Uncharacterized protein n=1 Tax=Stylosanthes scabra TaxID=79078 RepID=A0ABU6SL56_9FABA|nr:hypothetical protein [Stylosanthes scabra]
MPSSESAKPSSNQSLDREIREMVSAITNRVTDFHKSGSTGHHHHHSATHDDDDHGVRIITLAGTNDGATLKGELDDKSPGKSSSHHHHHHDHDDVEAEPLSTYVNSNFQAINNSMMIGGSFHANDPGVHLDISDFTEPTIPPHHHKHGKKGKKKEKEGSKSDHHSSHHSD